MSQWTFTSGTTHSFFEQIHHIGAKIANYLPVPANEPSQEVSQIEFVIIDDITDEQKRIYSGTEISSLNLNLNYLPENTDTFILQLPLEDGSYVDLSCYFLSINGQSDLGVMYFGNLSQIISEMMTNVQSFLASDEDIQGVNPMTYLKYFDLSQLENYDADSAYSGLLFFVSPNLLNEKQLPRFIFVRDLSQTASNLQLSSNDSLICKINKKKKSFTSYINAGADNKRAQCVVVTHPAFPGLLQSCNLISFMYVPVCWTLASIKQIDFKCSSNISSINFSLVPQELLSQFSFLINNENVFFVLQQLKIYSESMGLISKNSFESKFEATFGDNSIYDFKYYLNDSPFYLLEEQLNNITFITNNEQLQCDENDLYSWALIAWRDYPNQYLVSDHTLTFTLAVEEYTEPIDDYEEIDVEAIENYNIYYSDQIQWSVHSDGNTETSPIQKFWSIQGSINPNSMSIYNDMVYLISNKAETKDDAIANFFAGTSLSNSGGEDLNFNFYFQQEANEENAEEGDGEEEQSIINTLSDAFTATSGTENHFYVCCLASGNENLNINIDEAIYYIRFECLSGDSLITMADGTQKMIKDLTVKDRVLGKNKNPVGIVKIANQGISPVSNYYYFDDGTIIHTTNPHRFFNIEQGFYQYLHLWNIGERAVKIDGSTPALIKREIKLEQDTCYGLWTTDKTYWAEGLLTSETAANEELLKTMDTASGLRMVKSLLHERKVQQILK